METKIELRDKCPDCQVSIGEKHVMFCDVTRCKTTGTQLLSCYTDPDDLEYGEELDHLCEPTIWTGEWPGVKVCRENNWYANYPGLNGTTLYGEDLNSVPFRAVWNPEIEDWEARK
jgi:hypothetical protein